jgi:hypothetical protein
MTSERIPASPPTHGPTTPGYSVYYADSRIAVTSWQVVMPDGRRLMTAELTGVLRVLTYAHPGRTVALIVGGVEIVAAAPFAVGYHSAGVLLAGFVAALGVACGVLVDARQNPRWLQLRATYRNEEIVLFSCRRLDEFERVRWAFIRALEDNEAPLG